MKRISDATHTTRVLYISYDGVLEPLGESQVVPCLERLAANWSVTLLSFEKREDRDDARTAAMRTRLEGAGIRWRPRAYHRHPLWLAKLFDVLVGSWIGLTWSLGRGRRIIHARGYLPVLMGWPATTATASSLIFDMRGLWADERVDRGVWAPRSIAYRVAKWWERRFFESADAIVSLTRAAVDTFPQLGYRLRGDVRIRVIPTCVDLDRFRPGEKNARLAGRLGLGRSLTFGCIGTMSHAYMRREMLQCLHRLTAGFADSRVLIVTREDHMRLREDAAQAGLDPDRMVIVRADHSEMPDLVRLIDVGVFFIRPCVSARAAAATKLGEFLASGVPVVTNAGVGDSSDLVRSTRTGIVLDDVTAHALDVVADEVRRLMSDGGVHQRCREAAMRHFDVAAGAGAYASLYTALATGRRSP